MDYEFVAMIRKVEGIDGAFVEFPFDVGEEFGTKGRVQVKATFDGVEYRGSLVRMGPNATSSGSVRRSARRSGKAPGIRST
jgi:hypothetical protein